MSMYGEGPTTHSNARCPSAIRQSRGDKRARCDHKRFGSSCKRGTDLFRIPHSPSEPAHLVRPVNPSLPANVIMCAISLCSPAGDKSKGTLKVSRRKHDEQRREAHVDCRLRRG